MLLTVLLTAMLGAEPADVPAPAPSAPPLVPVAEVAPPTPPRVSAATVRVSDPRKRLIVAGASIFAGTYLANVAVGLILEAGARGLPVFPPAENTWRGLFVPVVGPIIAAADPRNAATAPGNVLLLIGDSVVQLGALVVLVTGIALPAPKQQDVSAWLLPSLQPGFAGATFGLHF